MSFLFNLGSNVVIDLNNITAQVIGRAEYLNGTPNNYWLYYLDAQGDAIKNWFEEQELSPVE